MIRSWKKYPTLYAIFPLVNRQLTIEIIIRSIVDNYVITFFILEKKKWLLKKKKNIADILSYIFHYSGLLLPRIITHQ